MGNGRNLCCARAGWPYRSPVGQTKIHKIHYGKTNRGIYGIIDNKIMQIFKFFSFNLFSFSDVSNKISIIHQQQIAERPCTNFLAP